MYIIQSSVKKMFNRSKLLKLLKTRKSVQLLNQSGLLSCLRNDLNINIEFLFFFYIVDPMNQLVALTNFHTEQDSDSKLKS